jgi:hypothetical protein
MTTGYLKAADSSRVARSPRLWPGARGAGIPQFPSGGRSLPWYQLAHELVAPESPVPDGSPAGA